MQLDQRFQEIVEKAPKGWHGTTYPNDKRYVGRDKFVDVMLSLLQSGEEIKTEYLSQFYPEDYVRLGSPFSTLLEMKRALGKFYLFMLHAYMRITS